MQAKEDIINITKYIAKILDKSKAKLPDHGMWKNEIKKIIQ